MERRMPIIICRVPGTGILVSLDIQRCYRTGCEDAIAIYHI